jgi:hypothetical protein
VPQVLALSHTVEDWSPHAPPVAITVAAVVAPFDVQPLTVTVTV